MASKYEQFQSFTSGYEKHPEQGLKTCKKKLQKDPSNTLYLVSRGFQRFRDLLINWKEARTSPISA
jgi:hypothetical protein